MVVPVIALVLGGVACDGRGAQRRRPPGARLSRGLDVRDDAAAAVVLVALVVWYVDTRLPEIRREGSHAATVPPWSWR